MSYRFGLKRHTIGSSAFSPLLETEFNSIRRAKAGMLECFFIEQKFDFLIENYLEFEKDLLCATADHMVIGTQDSYWYQSKRDLFNRRIMNLLTTGKTYIDCAPQHVNNFLKPTSAEALSVKKIFNDTYDAYLGYRAMYEIRNFVQHRGLPVHGSRFGASWINREDERMMLNTICPYLNVSELQADSSVKKTVREELEKQGATVDLKLMIREYVEGLWVVHEKIRTLLKPAWLDAEQVFNKAIEKYEIDFPDEESIIGLAAIKLDSKGNLLEEDYLVKTFIEYHEMLVRKNSSLVKLSKRFVSSEIVAG